MEKLIQSYLEKSPFVERNPKVRFVNKDYKDKHTVIFTYSHDGSKHDKTAELNIWDLLVFVHNHH